MKFSVLIILLFPFISYGQTTRLTDNQINGSGANRLFFVEGMEEARKMAELDINNGLPFLFLQSGETPIVYSSDSMFEAQFGVYYYEVGCGGPNRELSKKYNHRIFKYLSKNFGNRWKRKIRKDVIGFNRWKNYNIEN